MHLEAEFPVSEIPRAMSPPSAIAASGPPDPVTLQALRESDPQAFVALFHRSCEVEEQGGDRAGRLRDARLMVALLRAADECLAVFGVDPVRRYRGSRSGSNPVPGVIEAQDEAMGPFWQALSHETLSEEEGLTLVRSLARALDRDPHLQRAWFLHVIMARPLWRACVIDRHASLIGRLFANDHDQILLGNRLTRSVVGKSLRVQREETPENVAATLAALERAGVNLNLHSSTGTLLGALLSDSPVVFDGFVRYLGVYRVRSATSHSGDRLQHWAARLGSGDTGLRRLLALGADFGARNDEGLTALDVASESGELCALRFLVDTGHYRQDDVDAARARARRLEVEAFFQARAARQALDHVLHDGALAIEPL